MKVALGIKWRNVKAALQCTRDRKEWRVLGTYIYDRLRRGQCCNWSVFFLIALPFSGGITTEEEWDAVI